MTSSPNGKTIQFALPKGRMHDGVRALLADAGIRVHTPPRGYRPSVSMPGFETKILKPQNIVEMLHAGSRDLGFAGKDWVHELDVDLVELLDTGLDPVRIVAAAPPEVLENDALPTERSIVVASEYERLTKAWIAERGLNAQFVHSYGATEVFPPEDADCIVDNTATGSTLRDNGLHICDELLRSSTRLYAHPGAMQDPDKRALIEPFVLLLRSVLEARQRVMIEVNVANDLLEIVIDALPCMREPTISRLHHEAGYAVKAAVPRHDLPVLIPLLKQRGATDIVVSSLSQIVP